jgi:aminoglycoside/choline kinase family phosphotransferase
LLRRELDLFPDWYNRPARRRCRSKPAQRDTLSNTFRRILDNNPRQPRVYVHRVLPIRANLMVSDPNPGVLDFPGRGFTGRITYDLVSLAARCYVELGRSTADRLGPCATGSRARAAKNFPSAMIFGVFWRDFEWMGVNGSSRYWAFSHASIIATARTLPEEMPRVMHYVRKSSSRYDELSPLLRPSRPCSRRDSPRSVIPSETF